VRLTFIKAKTGREFFSFVIPRALLPIIEGIAEKDGVSLGQLIINDITSRLARIESALQGRGREKA